MGKYAKKLISNDALHGLNVNKREASCFNEVRTSSLGCSMSSGGGSRCRGIDGRPHPLG